MNYSQAYPVAKYKRLLTLLLSVVVISVALSFHVSTAHAQQSPQANLNWIPQDILNSMSSLDTSDCNTGSGMFAQGEYPWIYEGASTTDGSAANPLPAVAGQPMNLNIYEETFLCFWATNPASNPEQNIFYGDTNTPHDSTVDAAPFGLSFEPIPAGDWPGGGGQLLSNQSKFQFGTPQVNGVNTGGIQGNNPQITNFGNGSRYWEPYNGSTWFSYTAPNTVGLTQVTLTLPVYGANQFTEQSCPTDSGGFCSTGNGPPSVNDNCIGYSVFGQAGGTMDSNYYDTNSISAGCLPQTATFRLWINVTSAFNNTATLAPATSACNGGIPTAAGGNVTPGENICLDPGMYKTGPSTGPVTYVELRAYSGSNDVTNIGSTPTTGLHGTDPAPLGGASFDSGNMADGEGTVPHYWWGRETDPAGTIDYQPAEYQVTSSAKPGDQICFRTAATPENSGGGTSFSTPICYTVVEQLTCSSFSAAVTAAETPVETDQPFTITVTPATGGYMPTAAEGTMTATITTPGSATVKTFTLTPGATNYSLMLSNIMNADAGYGPHSVTWAFTTNVSYISNFNSGTNGCPPANFLVAALPYFRVFGGDVSAGVNSTHMASCYDTVSGITSFNKGVAGSGIGAGTTHADLATGTISQFVSGQSNSLFSTLDPLSFANNGASQYGGGYGTSTVSSSNCVGQDYYGLSVADPNDHICPNPISVATVQAQVPSINISSMQPGQRYVCHANSANEPHVVIQSPVVYNTASANATNLPFFEVVTSGIPIYILNGVGTISGNIIAQGSTIYDTTNGYVSVPSGNSATNTALIDDNRLTINGTFIANQLDLYRVYGSLSDGKATTTPPDPTDAEEFDYSPINWLAPSDKTQPIVQSITSLPPVL